jgi:tetratricopeptide (TPR) repeat protein
LRRYEEALAAFDQALQLDPSASEPESGKDYIFTHIFYREPQKRAASLRKHDVDKEQIARPCHSARDYYEVGCQLITLDRGDEAFRAFARSIELDSLDLDVYEYVTRLYFVRGNHEKSLATYQQALHIFPECAKLHAKRAQALAFLERHQEALDACNRAIHLDETCASAYCQKGEILHQVRRFQEALDAFDQAISLDPDASTPYEQKAKVLADVRRYDAALAAYDQAIRLDAYDVFLCRDKAELLLQVGQDADAPIVVDQFIERTPESFEGYSWKLLFLAEH